MKCNESQILIKQLFLSHRKFEDSAELQAHMISCKGCKKYKNEIQAINLAYDTLERVEAPYQVLVQLNRDIFSPVAEKSSNKKVYYAIFGTVGALVIVLFVYFLSGRQNPKQEVAKSESESQLKTEEKIARVDDVSYDGHASSSQANDAKEQKPSRQVSPSDSFKNHDVNGFDEISKKLSKDLQAKMNAGEEDVSDAKDPIEITSQPNQPLSLDLTEPKTAKLNKPSLAAQTQVLGNGMLSEEQKELDLGKQQDQKNEKVAPYSQQESLRDQVLAEDSVDSSSDAVDSKAALNLKKNPRNQNHNDKLSVSKSSPNNSTLCSPTHPEIADKPFEFDFMTEVHAEDSQVTEKLLLNNQSQANVLSWQVSALLKKWSAKNPTTLSPELLKYYLGAGQKNPLLNGSSYEASSVIFGEGRRGYTLGSGGGGRIPTGSILSNLGALNATALVSDSLVGESEQRGLSGLGSARGSNEGVLSSRLRYHLEYQSREPKPNEQSDECSEDRLDKNIATVDFEN